MHPGAIALARRALTSTKLMVLVRPRGGDFLYDDSEMDVSGRPQRFLKPTCACHVQQQQQQLNSSIVE